MIRKLLNAFLCLACLVLASCASSFDREYKRINDQESRHDRDVIAGPWQGTWRSEVNGHHGELRCLVDDPLYLASMRPAPPGFHIFRYHATFLGALSATYDVTHMVRRTKEGCEFSGDQKLSGMGGGLYHYEGRVSDGKFHATFRSATDHGVFEMKRPD